ncbi:MAG: dihydroneopterin aldolase [Dysgonamonadaceae bacterium]|jgi:dihydroneopterin aldolase|nr:dihydroneopterin aldolase [Dysgonamonadaceae bacterium]
MQSTIQLTGLEFYAFHGVTEQERTVGNTFLVDISIDADLSKSMDSDRLEDTINYAKVYTLTKKEMEIPSNLLEHVAGRILHTLLNHFSAIEKTTVAIAKKNPPIEGQVDWAKVIVSQCKN